MIKAVIFDLGGVLIKDRRQAAMAFCCGTLGIYPDDFKFFVDMYIDQFQRGMPESEFWEKASAYFDIPIYSNLWEEAYKRFHFPNKEMFNLAVELKGEGIKTMLLLNTEEPAVKQFYENGYTMFDHAIFSCVEGYLKPGQEIYKIALSKIGLLASSVLFIDDSLENIRGAAAAGINVFHFDKTQPVSSLVSQIKEVVNCGNKRF